MLKIIRICIFLSVGLFAVSHSKPIDMSKFHNYNIDTVTCDFNSDGNKDLIYSLQNDTFTKSKLIIYEGTDNGKYTKLLDSDKAISYPKNNGEGYMLREIALTCKNDSIIIETNSYSGSNILTKFFFKYKNKSFYFNGYKEYIGSRCNNYTIIKERELLDFTDVLKLKNFSIDLFFHKYYTNPTYYKLIKRKVMDNLDFLNDKLKNSYKNKKKFMQYIKNVLVYTDNEKLCTEYSYLDMYLYLDNKNTINKSNNIAYYLQKAGANEEAIYLLEKIVAKFPKRTVAYYNLGDAYWALGEKAKARKAYTTYIEQMCHKGLQKKIPEEIFKRVTLEML